MESKKQPSPNEYSNAYKAYKKGFEVYLSSRGIGPQGLETIRQSGQAIAIELSGIAGEPVNLNLPANLHSFIKRIYAEEKFKIQCVYFSEDSMIMDLELLSYPHQLRFPRGYTNDAHIQFIFNNQFNKITCYAFGPRARQERVADSVVDELLRDIVECPPSILNDLVYIINTLPSREDIKLSFG